MNRKSLVLGFITAATFCAVACNSGGDKTAADKKDSSSTSSNNTASNESSTKGIGPHQNIQLTHPIDEAMATTGKGIYDVKCASCHKLTDEKLVGPGWKGVTDRRTPEWIMNFVTNVDEMIEKDPQAQKMLEECLVRMPNQNLSETDARAVLEFQRKNDGKN